jgi:hypothetical protein
MGKHPGAWRVTGVAVMAPETSLEMSDATLTHPQPTCAPLNDMPLLLVRIQALDARLTCLDVSHARAASDIYRVPDESSSHIPIIRVFL